MLINPREAVNKGWIKFPTWMSEEFKEKCIQPNAIDFTLDRLFNLNKPIITKDPIVINNIGFNPSYISEIKREFYLTTEQFSQVHFGSDLESTFLLQPNEIYDGMSDFIVNVPENICAMLINRSSLNRVGVHLNSGLYDSGFNGSIGFTLSSRHGVVQIAPNTRVGQIMFIQSSSAKQYDGMYNNIPEGEHWNDRT